MTDASVTSHVQRPVDERTGVQLPPQVSPLKSDIAVTAAMLKQLRNIADGSGILYKLQKPCFDHLDAPIEYVHSDEIPVPFNHFLEEAMMPSVDRIVAAVKEVCYR